MINLTVDFVGYDIWFSVKWNMHDWWMDEWWCIQNIATGIYTDWVVCRHNFLQTQINLSSIEIFKPHIFQLIFGFRNALGSAILGLDETECPNNFQVEIQADTFLRFITHRQLDIKWWVFHCSLGVKLSIIWRCHRIGTANQLMK